MQLVGLSHPVCYHDARFRECKAIRVVLSAYPIFYQFDFLSSFCFKFYPFLALTWFYFVLVSYSPSFHSSFPHLDSEPPLTVSSKTGTQQSLQHTNYLLH